MFLFSVVRYVGYVVKLAAGEITTIDFVSGEFCKNPGYRHGTKLPSSARIKAGAFNDILRQLAFSL